MRKIFLLGLSVFTMLLSCKCKKEVTDTTNVSAQNLQPDTNSTSATNTMGATKIENTVPVLEKTQEQGTIVTYEANTRGYFMKLKFSNNQLSFTKVRDNDDLTVVTLTKAELDELNSLVSALNLESLPKLKDPTQKRFYDGAAIAHLSVIKDGKEFTTVDFDHGIPPAEIEKFVKKLVSYTEEKQ